MILPDKPGAVIRWKYKYDGVYQYQVAVLTYSGDYEQGLVWYRSPGWVEHWTAEELQKRIDSDPRWGEWEILHPGEEEE